MSCQEWKEKGLWIESFGELIWEGKKLARNNVGFLPLNKELILFEMMTRVSLWPSQKAVSHTLLPGGSVPLLGTTRAFLALSILDMRSCIKAAS